MRCRLTSSLARVVCSALGPLRGITSAFLKKKALVIPRSGPSAEQTTRARLLVSRHLIDVLYPANLSPETLAERLQEDLKRSDYPLSEGTLPMDGATRAADRLVELLQVHKEDYAASI